MSNRIKIRKYEPEDFERLCQVHDPARKNELALAGLSAAFVPLSVAAEREGLFDYQVYVAECEGGIGGFVAFSPEELAWLYVDKSLAGNGIGSQLIEFALKMMEDDVSIEVLAGNEPALALYAKFGFAIERTETGVMPGNETFPVTVHILRKYLKKYYCECTAFTVNKKSTMKQHRTGGNQFCAVFCYLFNFSKE